MSRLQIAARVQKHRDALRLAELRPVQIWAPDTRRPDFAEECRRQARLVAEADNVDKNTEQLLDDAQTDIDGWTE
jgi:hypothetical protein